MSCESAAKLKEDYLELCLQKNIKPHEYIFTGLQEATKSCFLSGSDNLLIDLSGNNKLLIKSELTDLDIEILCNVLIKSTTLRCLNFSYNKITDKAAKSIAKLIQENFSIEKINVMCNDISEDGAKYIAHSLYTAKTLRVLKINGNKIGDKGGLAIATALKVNKTLIKLDLGDCNLKMDSIIGLTTILQHHKYLISLNLNRPILFSLQEEMTVHVSNMLKVNNTLEELHLQKFNIRDFGVKRLCEVLKKNCTLTYLDISCNRVSRDGALYLSDMLKCNQTLEILDLGNNRIEGPGATDLAATLAETNRVLHTLVLVNNEIKSDGLICIAAAIDRNPVLTNVYIWGNFINDQASTVFGELINAEKLKLKNTDVKPYYVDGKTYLAQLSHGVNIHYYWKPSYGLNYVSPFDNR